MKRWEPERDVDYQGVDLVGLMFCTLVGGCLLMALIAGLVRWFF